LGRLAAFLLALSASGSLFVWRGGQWLVAEMPIQPSDAILVLAGDYSGRRVLKGCEVLRAGHAPRAFFSGPRGFFGQTEDQVAIPYAISNGCPPERLIGIPHQALSTREEAREIRDRLRREGVQRCLLVTSDFHTRRALRIFRSLAPEIEFIPVPAPTAGFEPARWWSTRQGQKIFLTEWLKTVADWMGI
jgi:uncharacterized SAM-binding protein YcdF (DUF218 family)